MLKLSFISLLFIFSLANAEETRHANAHVHGLNNLTMVLSQNQIAITYEMPIIQLYEEHEEHEVHLNQSFTMFRQRETIKISNYPMNFIAMSLIY